MNKITNDENEQPETISLHKRTTPLGKRTLLSLANRGYISRSADGYYMIIKAPVEAEADITCFISDLVGINTSISKSLDNYLTPTDKSLSRLKALLRKAVASGADIESMLSDL